MKEVNMYVCGGDPVPTKEWLDSRQGQPDYPSALALYRIYWGVALLFAFLALGFCCLFCYCGIASDIANGYYGSLILVSVFIGMLILSDIHKSYQKKASPPSLPEPESPVDPELEARKYHYAERHRRRHRHRKPQ